jgi:hypothetical protein
MSINVATVTIQVLRMFYTFYAKNYRRKLLRIIWEIYTLKENMHVSVKY